MIIKLPILILLYVYIVYATVNLSPDDNIQEIVNKYPAGTTYIAKSGVYRMQSIIPKEGDTFIGQPGAILNGSMLLNPADAEYDPRIRCWKFVGIKSTPNPFYKHGQCLTCEDGDTIPCYQPEDVIVNGSVFLKKYPVAENLIPGTYCIRTKNNEMTIYLKDNPRTFDSIEVSISQFAFGIPLRNRTYGEIPVHAPDKVTIRGFIIEKYATLLQMGAIGNQYPGEQWVIEDNEVRYNHGAGIRFGKASIVRNNYSHHNGQIGIKGGGYEGEGFPSYYITNTIVENNHIAYNCLEEIGVDYWWEGGATKFSYTKNLIVRGNYVHNNNGMGLWTDIDNIDVIYDSNLVENNQHNGIFHEISYGAVIKNNIVRNNGIHGHRSGWSANINITNSEGVLVYNNTVQADNKGYGIFILLQPREGSYYARNNMIYNNILIKTTPGGVAGIYCDYDQETFLKKANNKFKQNKYYLSNTQHFRVIDQTLSSNDFGEIDSSCMVYSLSTKTCKESVPYQPREVKTTKFVNVLGRIIPNPQGGMILKNSSQEYALTIARVQFNR